MARAVVGGLITSTLLTLLVCRSSTRFSMISATGSVRRWEGKKEEAESSEEVRASAGRPSPRHSALRRHLCGFPDPRGLLRGGHAVKS